MVYRKKLVAVVKCNGKVLRERDELITLPFGSEYSLLFKNLDSRRSSVSASIDGRDVFYGHSLIIEPNKEVEVYGFLTGSSVRNKFKFIQKTQKIQEHRGDKIDDGIIRIEFAFEKPILKKTIIHEEHHHHHNDHFFHYYPPVMGQTGLDNHWRNTVYTSNSSDIPRATSNVTLDSLGHGVESNVREISDNVAMYSSTIPQTEEGITVEGSRINQDFAYGSIGELEDSDVIILRMTGVKNSGQTINTPLTVKQKLFCKTCGTSSKSNAKFCIECGTSLDI